MFTGNSLYFPHIKDKLGSISKLTDSVFLNQIGREFISVKVVAFGV